MSASVAVLGGGVAGLTAAQELLERGYRVELFEARERLGGKARSMPFPGSGIDGRRDLPGEHGFRFFPGFYRHVPDTMGRIPAGDGRTVLDCLVPTTRIQIARAGDFELVSPAHYPATPADLLLAFRFFFRGYLRLPSRERRHFMFRLLELLTSCQPRRLHDYEHTSWWNYVEAERLSQEFQKYFADGLTRTLVAARAREISTRTAGFILLQLMFDLLRPGGQADRVLNGPTSDVWIDPWRRYLADSQRWQAPDRFPVKFHFGTSVRALQFDDRRIRAIALAQGDRHYVRDDFDYCVAALPVEIMRRLVTPAMQAAEPSLGRLDNLRTAWMNGILFYLDRDVPLVHGHTLYIDSPWALTSVSHKQFWPDYDLAGCGDGRCQGVLSVDISDWTTPGILHKRAAMYCSREEIRDEVWAQLKAHLHDDEVKDLDSVQIVAWFLDPAIEFPNPSRATNLEPLLINTAGSWQDRPEAVLPGIQNLFLAGDYVRTFTDLASMESANEAGRRAANGVLDASGSKASRCRIWPLKEPRLLAPLRAYDLRRHRRGRPYNRHLLWVAWLIFLPLWWLAYWVARCCWWILRLLHRVRLKSLPAEAADTAPAQQVPESQ